MDDILTKIALVFPGVGSQHYQMGKSFYDNFIIARQTFEEASDVINEDFKSICFLSENSSQLNRIDISQLALITVSMAIFRVYEQEIGIKPEFCLGHSLGEYTALCASKSISFKDVLKIVRQRGDAIKEASSFINGTMMWVVNLPWEKVQKVCREFSKEEQQVYLSAYDYPTQCSISGHSELLIKAAKELETRGAIVYPLKFSGPFHSPLMEKAYLKMDCIIKDYTFKNPEYKLISNINAEPYKDAEEIQKLLPKQLISPIKWQQSIEYLLEHGVSGVIEIGPKDVLKFLIKKITQNLNVISYNDFKYTDLVKRTFLLDESERLNFIERCLKAAVSTKNYNSGQDNYQKRVVKPYKDIEMKYLNIVKNGFTPDKKMVSDSLDMLISVMEEKCVPEDIKKVKLYFVLQGKVNITL